ncbi:hypothetical protein [Latilactobacillus graminis]|uniref:Uncharacterized protein n=2 Tax=Latilactobacillus graminis TaxID=60519 RepID=A0AA89I184_9LACO|nr:hypothetical protein [Latilactobacillus graminis]KRM22406.1 hypothetical protein FC90_GL001008 [Latilactobacillus graminis DSM 20719]QFP79423.1 hypothetical protein LG542_03905 [Latilactobacillus graminis]
MHLILAIILYAGLAIFIFGMLLLLLFLIFKKRLKAPLIICLLGLIVAASPVGYNFYTAQKQHREELAKIEKKDKKFDQAERHFIKHIKKATVATEYVAQKYNKVWRELTKNGTVNVAGVDYNDHDAAVASEARLLLTKGKLDDADDYLVSAQSDYQKMKASATDKNRQELIYAKTVLSKTGSFIDTATRPNGTFQEYTDAVYKANQRHIRAIQKLKFTYSSIK